MNKCDDKFCCDCGHHLYKMQAGYWCQECRRFVDDEEIATRGEVILLRKGYDAQARQEYDEYHAEMTAPCAELLGVKAEPTA